MAILFDSTSRLFTLETNHSMYQMKADRYGVLLHTWFGMKGSVFDYSYLISYADRGFSGNPYEAEDERTYSLDVLPQEYPTYGSGDYRSSALKVRYPDGTTACELRYAGHKTLEGKYALPGLPAIYATEDTKADTLVITLEDTRHCFYVHLYYGVLEELDMITRSVRIENHSDAEIYLENVQSTCIDYLHGEFDLHTFYGRHVKERNYQRMTLRHGIQSVGSTRGTSSHQYNPFLILSGEDTTEENGSCYGFSFLYSGDFLGTAEYDQYNQTRILLGIHPDNFCYCVKPGESFYAPEVAMAYSHNGLGELSRIYHKAYRNHLCRGKWTATRRPVLLNSWEGIYFDFNGEKLVKMAKDAAELGVELFVMDDGWFGKRELDVSGLGDWIVNEKKLGCTLGELSDQIHDLGMQFGIWFEPEGINEDSDLYRAHPDWALQVPGKSPCRSRQQLLLDFSREDVRDYIFSHICQVLDSAKIEYLKWDLNRSLSDLYSALLPADRQGEVAHRFVLGLYDMLEKLTQRYPDMLIEGCSGGGGRFDAGMLYYTPQIWCSDDTDAIERLSIQYGTSFGYPVSTMGSHVSKCPNEQTGRNTPINTRATVAMSGTFGYELDVNEMSEEDKSIVRSQIDEFKKYYDLIQYGDYYRLTNPDTAESYHGWEFAAADGSEALLCIVALQIHPNGPGCWMKVKGLKPDSIYTVDGKEYPGDVLMNGGLLLPAATEEYESFRIHIVEKMGI
ncbi:alpha-galactosidase [Bariatricus sp. SGI.154]|uniref:alpha-galactosidase n=1 Tax=Bariatricus sp. SGI.154 TaxID=3420549 RepID=UPI003D08EE0F